MLRHLQEVSPRAVNRIKAAIGEAAVPVAVTVDLGSADEHVRALVAQLCNTVRLPCLREMPAQVPRLITDILHELPGAQRSTRFSSEALQLLMHWSWPPPATCRRTCSRRRRGRIGRTTLYRKLQAYRIKVESASGAAPTTG